MVNNSNVILIYYIHLLYSSAILICYTCLLYSFAVSCPCHVLAGARSVHIKQEDYTVHDVANVLKRYLRNLKEPVMSSLLYGQWLSAASM